MEAAEFEVDEKISEARYTLKKYLLAKRSKTTLRIIALDYINTISEGNLFFVSAIFHKAAAVADEGRLDGVVSMQRVQNLLTRLAAERFIEKVTIGCYRRIRRYEKKSN